MSETCDRCGRANGAPEYDACCDSVDGLRHSVERERARAGRAEAARDQALKEALAACPDCGAQFFGREGAKVLDERDFARAEVERLTRECRAHVAARAAAEHSLAEARAGLASIKTLRDALGVSPERHARAVAALRACGEAIALLGKHAPDDYYDPRYVPVGSAVAEASILTRAVLAEEPAT